MSRCPIVLLLLAGCQPTEAPSDGNAVDETIEELSEEVKSLPIGATTPASLEGEWRVAGINRQLVDLDWAMTAGISDRDIRIQSQCVWFERGYVLSDMQLLPFDLEKEPQVMCQRGWLPEEEAANQALQQAEWAYRLPDGSLVLDGPGGSITLFTQ